MKGIHEIEFPRYRDDVMTQRRTLLHVPVDDHYPAWTVGDDLHLLAAPGYPRCAVGVVTHVGQVRLLDGIDADLPKLCAGRDEYLSRWDALHPDLSSARDPVVWRIEFRYADPPAWSMAT